MFSDNEIKAYRSIKAPEGIYEKLSRPQRSYADTLRIITAVAACFVLVISAVFVFKGENDVIVNGQKLNGSVVFYDTSSAMARSVSSTISVPLEFKVSDKTTVSALQGSISVDGEPKTEVEILKSEVIWWEVPTDKDEVFKLLVTDKKGVKTISLKYENTKITVTKEN